MLTGYKATLTHVSRLYFRNATQDKHPFLVLGKHIPKPWVVEGTPDDFAYQYHWVLPWKPHLFHHSSWDTLTFLAVCLKADTKIALCDYLKRFASVDANHVMEDSKG